MRICANKTDSGQESMVFQMSQGITLLCKPVKMLFKWVFKVKKTQPF
jgi:hypothetical protein